jgi:sporulation protein YlmC with PRC-barrel domain
MNVKTMVAVSALLLAAPALAEEPTASPATQPSTEAAPTPLPADPMANPTPPATEPMNDTTTDPGMTQAPSANDTSPGAAKPMDQMGAEPNAAPPAPDAPKQAATDAPAAVVITELNVSKDGKKIVAPLGMPVDSVAELDVYDAKGKKIGQVDSVLEDTKGEVKGIAVGYGGFLGFGEKHSVLTFDQVKLKDGTLVTELSEDQLREQPTWTKKK